jgi:SAM-dependent methyltransferase
MADAVGAAGRVIGIELSEQQIAVARERSLAKASTAKRNAATTNTATTCAVAEYRLGRVEEPPLFANEWGTFDVAHARFVLEHVQRPLDVVRNMVESVRPGGRVILADDDHPLLKLWPECPGVDAAWTAYQRVYEINGNDPIVGRRLVALLHQAGAKPVRNDWLFFGSCAGSPEWTVAVANFIGVLRSAAERMIAAKLIGREGLEQAYEALGQWKSRPDAAIWYAMAWAEGVRPSGVASVH